MSHFSVLVIGENVEAQLQPYHEFECTGTNDEFVQDVDVTSECIDAETGEQDLSCYGLKDKTVTDEAQVDRDDAHKYGYALVDAEGKLIKAINRTNPNKTWDWWVVGGRWSGFLKLKPGATGALGRKGLMGSCANDGPGHADVATKATIDFDGMRDDAGLQAGAKWDKAAAAHQGQTWEPWSSVGPRTGYSDDGRKFYREQPAVAAMLKAFDNPLRGVDQYLTPRDQFVQQARDAAVSSYAVVKDGQWYAKGKMGWFGMSDDKVSQEYWNRKVGELLDGLPDDTVITVVDCHI
jgi:hypothetical protein